MESVIKKLGKTSVTVEKDYHSSKKEYNKLTVVEEEGAFKTYLSRKPVPVGIELTNREYWIPFSGVLESIVFDYLKFKKDYGSGKAIEDNAIITRHILNRSIERIKIALKAISEEEIDNNAIIERTIKDRNITSNKIAQENILTEHFAKKSVITSILADYAITAIKLADNSVTTRSIVNENVTQEKLANNSVNESKIVDKTITNSKIADDTIELEKLSTTLQNIINSVTNVPEDLIRLNEIDNELKKLIVAEVVRAKDAENTNTQLINDEVTKLNKIDNEIKEKLNDKTNEINVAKEEALQAIAKNEQSAITNFNSQRVTPEMLSESTKQLIEASGGGTITNLADDEDITSVDDGTGSNVIKFADRTYNPDNFSGKGYKILRKNIVDGKNILTQNMINDSNVTYEIKYDFDLNEQEVIIPKGCVLKFEGGSFRNGVLIGNNTNIISKYHKTILIDTILKNEINTQFKGIAYDWMFEDTKRDDDYLCLLNMFQFGIQIVESKSVFNIKTWTNPYEEQYGSNYIKSKGFIFNGNGCRINILADDNTPERPFDSKQTDYSHGINLSPYSFINCDFSYNSTEPNIILKNVTIIDNKEINGNGADFNNEVLSYNGNTKRIRGSFIGFFMYSTEKNINLEIENVYYISRMCFMTSSSAKYEQGDEYRTNLAYFTNCHIETLAGFSIELWSDDIIKIFNKITYKNCNFVTYEGEYNSNHSTRSEEYYNCVFTNNGNTCPYIQEDNINIIIDSCTFNNSAVVSINMPDTWTAIDTTKVLIKNSFFNITLIGDNLKYNTYTSFAFIGARRTFIYNNCKFYLNNTNIIEQSVDNSHLYLYNCNIFINGVPFIYDSILTDVYIFNLKIINNNDGIKNYYPQTLLPRAINNRCISEVIINGKNHYEKIYNPYVITRYKNEIFQTDFDITSCYLLYPFLNKDNEMVFIKDILYYANQKPFTFKIDTNCKLKKQFTFNIRLCRNTINSNLNLNISFNIDNINFLVTANMYNLGFKMSIGDAYETVYLPLLIGEHDYCYTIVNNNIAYYGGIISKFIDGNLTQDLNTIQSNLTELLDNFKFTDSIVSDANITIDGIGLKHFSIRDFSLITHLI